VNLLRVAVEESVAMGTRQAAAISFKNLVRRDWEGTGARHLTQESRPQACTVRQADRP